MGERHRRQRRAAQPPDPRCGHRPGEPAGRLRGGRRLRREHAEHAGPRLPGHLHGQLRLVHLGQQERQPAEHSDRLDHRQPALPAAGLRGQRLGPVLHQRHHGRQPRLGALQRRHAQRDDLGPGHRSRLHHAGRLHPRPGRLRLAADRCGPSAARPPRPPPARRPPRRRRRPPARSRRRPRRRRPARPRRTPPSRRPPRKPPSPARRARQRPPRRAPPRPGRPPRRPPRAASPSAMCIPPTTSTRRCSISPATA